MEMGVLSCPFAMGILGTETFLFSLLNKSAIFP